MSNAIDRYGVSAWLDNIGLPKLADAVMDEKRFPPVQLEIIRCKDCKWADEYNHCAKVTWWNSKDDFCSRAERREDG